MNEAVLFARNNLLSFAIGMRPSYETPKHVELIAEKLQSLEARKIRRLMVFMPPRHGKSYLISQMFPSWYMGRNPGHQVIFTSYSAEIAGDFGRKVRNLMAEDNYGEIFENAQISLDSSAAHRFNVDGGGSYFAVGAGGPLTGRGGDLIIIDDIHKNRDEAHSDVMRKKIHEWFGSTLYTRLMPNAVMVVVQTRWHEDDLPGHLLAAKEEGWEVLSLPAIDDAGSALWTERFPIGVLEQIKSTIGSRDFEALYQQHPTPAEGNIIKRQWFKWYKQMPARFDQIIQSWDFAVKDKESSDFVVGLVIGRIAADKYVLDMCRGRMNFPASCQSLLTLSRKWPNAYKKLVEAKANGPAVIDTLNKQVPGLVAIEPDGDKVARMNAVAPDVESGNVYLPEDAPWVHDFVEELCAFPNGAHDDICDAFSQGIRELRRSGVVFSPVSGHGSGHIHR